MHIFASVLPLKCDLHFFFQPHLYTYSCFARLLTIFLFSSYGIILANFYTITLINSYVFFLLFLLLHWNMKNTLSFRSYPLHDIFIVNLFCLNFFLKFSVIQNVIFHLVSNNGINFGFHSYIYSFPAVFRF